jgi:hypothetical protein
MTEIRKTTSIPQLERRVNELFKLAEKRGLTPDDRPHVVVLTSGPKYRHVTKWLAGRHSATDPQSGVEVFTLRIGTPGSFNLPDDDEPETTPQPAPRYKAT